MTTSHLMMSSELQKQFDLLREELSTLMYHFDEFEELFAKSTDRIDLLNETAPVFFSMINSVLWADVFTRISCLAGPARTVMRHGPAKENLSLRRLPELVDAAVRVEVEAAVDKAVDCAKFTIAGRNQYYSHRDLPTALDANSLGVTLGSRGQIREVINASEAVIHAVARAYGQPPVIFLPHLGWGIAEDLLLALKEASDKGKKKPAEAG